TMATYVLVHGAYQGGWIWKRVVERLRAAGHQVHAPTLDGCAERHHLVRPGITVATHAQEIAQLLFYEDLARVVLVGTSSGGMVICKAAELARDRIARLVFVDALALMPGERVGDIVKRVSANETTAITTGPARTDAEKRLFADLDPDLRAWALARYTPHPVAALEAPVALGSFWSQAWPTTVIRCRRATNPPEAHQRVRRAAQLHQRREPPRHRADGAGRLSPRELLRALARSQHPPARGKGHHHARGAGAPDGPAGPRHGPGAAAFGSKADRSHAAGHEGADAVSSARTGAALRGRRSSPHASRRAGGAHAPAALRARQGWRRPPRARDLHLPGHQRPWTGRAGARALQHPLRRRPAVGRLGGAPSPGPHRSLGTLSRAGFSRKEHVMSGTHDHGHDHD